MEIVTKHFMKERAGRYAFIATTVGIGKPVHTIERINSNSGELCYVQVTDTGVVMVKSKDNAIITLYLANITEIQTYFVNGVPCVIEAIVKRNMKKGYVKMQNTFD